MLASVFLGAMTVGHIAIAMKVWPLLQRGYQDFTIFYTAGRMVRSGEPSQLYDLTAQYRIQSEFAPDVRIRQAALPYNHPPFEALLFVPFTVLRYVHAYLLWTFLNLVMLFFVVKKLAGLKELTPVPLRFSGIAAAGFFPLVITFIQGQDTLLLLLIVVAGISALERGNDAFAGALLALGLFKPNFALPLAVFLAVKRPRLLSGFVPVGLVLAAVSVGLVGWQGAVDYVRFVLYVEHSGVGGTIVSGMPNLRGLFDRLPGMSTLISSSQTSTLIASGALFVGTLWHLRKGNLNLLQTFSLSTVATVLISYHALPHDLILLLPATLYLFAGLLRSVRIRRDDAVLLFLLFLTPLYALLWFRWNQFSWFALVLLALYFRLALSSSPEFDVSKNAEAAG